MKKKDDCGKEKENFLMAIMITIIIIYFHISYTIECKQWYMELTAPW